MSRETNRPTLAEHLGMTQIGSIVQKKFFGGYEVPLMQFLGVSLPLFASAALFGRAQRDRLEVVVKLLVGLDAVGAMLAPFLPPNVSPRQAANSEEWVFEYLRKVANDGIKYYRDHCRKEPDNFLDLWLTSFSPPELDFRDFNKAKEIAKKKIRLGAALQQSDAWLCVGISLGATFPELTVRMWKKSFEKVDMVDMERNILAEVAYYVKEYFPELLDPLDLRSYEKYW